MFAFGCLLLIFSVLMPSFHCQNPIVGTNGHDSLIGTDGEDVIGGLDGFDIISGNDGADFLHGGDGVDIVSGNDGPDVVIGGPGHNFLEGGAGNDIIIGGPESDTIVGGEGNDIIFGGGGIDLIPSEVGDIIIPADDPSCTILPCFHDGVCGTNDRCQCINGYTGFFCETPPCFGGCLNGGGCAADLSCSCINGFSGTICEVPPECQSDAECGNDRKCENYLCIVPPECHSDTDCPRGEECDNEVCVVPPECLLDTDCERGEECKNVICVECDSDTDCGSGEKCMNEKCTKRSNGSKMKNFALLYYLLRAFQPKSNQAPQKTYQPPPRPCYPDICSRGARCPTDIAAPYACLPADGGCSPRFYDNHNHDITDKCLCPYPAHQVGGCDSNLCGGGICPWYREYQCRVNTCGYCRAEYLNLITGLWTVCNTQVTGQVVRHTTG